MISPKEYRKQGASIIDYLRKIGIENAESYFIKFCEFYDESILRTTVSLDDMSEWFFELSYEEVISIVTLIKLGS